MTDSPTSQAMHLAMTELKDRERRIAELEEALRESTADLEECQEELCAGPLSGLAVTIKKNRALLLKAKP